MIRSFTLAALAVVALAGSMTIAMPQAEAGWKHKHHHHHNSHHCWHCGKHWK